MRTQGLLFLFNLALVRAQAGDDSTTLDPSVIQAGSTFDGSGALGFDPVQAASTTSGNNFINFCKGKTITNGFQITDGSCNGIGM